MYVRTVTTQRLIPMSRCLITTGISQQTAGGSGARSMMLEPGENNQIQTS